MMLPRNLGFKTRQSCNSGLPRFYALGRTDSNRLLFVAFTVRRKLIRVISAREMTGRERRVYEAYDEQEKPENPSNIYV